MKIYLVFITLPDGARLRIYGLFSDCFGALLAAMEGFPDAKRISARRLPCQ